MKTVQKYNEVDMKRKVFQILVENTSGVLSRISGLFSRRGYSIESITCGDTADKAVSRVTIVASGDDEILDQIEKQLAKLVDVVDIRELKPDESVYRELALIKVKAEASERVGLITLANTFRANVIDVSNHGVIVEITGNSGKINAFIDLISGYEILEIARTGIAGLRRGTDGVVSPKIR